MDFSALARLASGHVEARIVQAAVGLGFFELLHEGPLNAEAVAASLQTDPRASELLLNALAALGLLKKAKGSFSLTDSSAAYLVRSSEKFFGDMILFDASLWDCWRDLPNAVRAGKPARRPDMFQGSARETERFINAMHSLVRARGDAEVLADKVDLSGVRDLLDVGSGPGTYPIHLCRKFPRLKAAIFDLPGTLRITERYVRQAGLGQRIRLFAGDYRSDPIPGKYQVALLSNIIHGESAEENKRLMQKLYHCLEQGGRVVIKDHILDDGCTGPPVGAIFSVLMLLTTERGRCYSFAEIRDWLDQAGFKQPTEISLPYPLSSSLIIAEKR